MACNVTGPDLAPGERRRTSADNAVSVAVADNA